MKQFPDVININSPLLTEARYKTNKSESSPFNSPNVFKKNFDICSFVYILQNYLFNEGNADLFRGFRLMMTS